MTQGHHFEVSEAVRLAHVPRHAAVEEVTNPLNTAEYVPRRAAVEADDQAGLTDAVAELAGSAASHAAVETNEERRGSHRRDDDEKEAGEGDFLRPFADYVQRAGDEPDVEPVQEDVHLGPFAAGTYGSRAAVAAEQPEEDPFLRRLVSVFDDQEAGAAVEPVERAEEVADTDADVAGDIQVDEGEDGPRQDDPFESLLATMRPVIREAMTEPQIQAHGRRIRRDEEPTYGYFSPYSNAVGRRAGLDYRKAHERAVELATDLSPEVRSDFDNYVLGLEGTAPEGYDLEAGTDTKNFFNGAGERTLEALQAGFMPEDFRDVASLEHAIEYMILGGFASLDLTYGGHRIVGLETAANILREATLRVADFDPTHAGLDYLYDRAALLAAAQRYESPHWKLNRAGRGAGDHTAEMVGTCLSAAEDTVAILYAQGHDSLLASPEPEEAAV